MRATNQAALLIVATFCATNAARSLRAADFLSMGSGNWEDSASWSGGVLPGAGDNVTIGPQSIHVNTDVAGTHGALNDLVIGASDESQLILSEGGALRAENVTLGVGALGTVNQSGGTLTTSWLMVGQSAEGQYNISDGAVDAEVVQVGLSAAGSLTQSGGTVRTDFLVVATGGRAGVYEMQGGTLDVGNDSNDVTVSGFVIAEDGTGTFNQTGGLVVVGTDMAMARDGGAMGTYNLSGGTLDLQGHVGPASGGFKSFFNMTGGTLVNPANIPQEPLGGRIELKDSTDPTIGQDFRPAPAVTLGYEIKSPGQSDLLVLHGDANELAGYLDVMVDPSIAALDLIGSEFHVIQRALNASAPLGQFSGLSEGTIFPVQSGSQRHYFQISYLGGEYPVFITAVVPEPSSLAMLLATLPLGYLGYRRRLV
jgi:hypothetical protein